MFESDQMEMPMPAGDLTVLVRPAVDREEVEELLDVQVLLLQLTDDDGGTTRILEVGRKRLPAPDEDSPNWGHVRFAGDPEEAGALLDDDTYETATMGRRHQPAARPVASGTWQLERSGRSTFLELAIAPEREDDRDLLDQLRIESEQRLVMTVKNPRVRSDAGLDEEERAELPDDLQARFDGNRWAPVDPIEFLDHVGVEFVLVSAEDADDSSAGTEG